MFKNFNKKDSLIQIVGIVFFLAVNITLFILQGSFLRDSFHPFWIYLISTLIQFILVVAIPEDFKNIKNILLTAFCALKFVFGFTFTLVNEVLIDGMVTFDVIKGSHQVFVVWSSILILCNLAFFALGFLYELCFIRRKWYETNKKGNTKILDFVLPSLFICLVVVLSVLVLNNQNKVFISTGYALIVFSVITVLELTAQVMLPNELGLGKVITLEALNVGKFLFCFLNVLINDAIRSELCSFSEYTGAYIGIILLALMASQLGGFVYNGVKYLDNYLQNR